MTVSAGDAYLEPRLVGDISGRFYVPAYQRGYRWGEVEVRRLLDDIWESRDKPYYLQPVVVKRHGDEWELVDGQQWLTTLFLIFQFMKREGLQSTGAGYSLRYETREGSAAYLRRRYPARLRELKARRGEITQLGPWRHVELCRATHGLGGGTVQRGVHGARTLA